MSYKGFRVADAHAHIYPGAIAEKATGAIGEFYHIQMNKVGYPHVLKADSDEAGVDRSLIFSVATTPKQVDSINRFILKKCGQYPSFVPACAMHPDYESFEKTMEKCKQNGFKAMKLHPDFQKFNIDDPRVFPIYKKAAELGMPIIFHVGDDRVDFSAPHRLASVMQRFPELICVAAHFGGYTCWPTVEKELWGANIYFDTSSSLEFISSERAREIVEFFGADKFMFGTDFPMWEAKRELELFMKIDLDDSQRRQILSGTFERLFGVEV